MLMFGWEINSEVEILKMKFDQNLCLNLWYELNPRVRCAFGNVFKYYLLDFLNLLLCCNFRIWLKVKNIKGDFVHILINAQTLY